MQVTFVHTLAALTAQFSELASIELPGLWVRHIVDELLLDRIRGRGHANEDDHVRLRGHLQIAEEMGSAAVLVTCSTLSPMLDGMRESSRIPLLKIDEGMVREAVDRGGRMVVLATNQATLEPTIDTLKAGGLAREPELVLIRDAFAAYRRGDFARHDPLVISAINDVAQRADTIILAQASMDRVVPQLDPAIAARVLTTPRAALRALRGLLQSAMP